MTQMYNNGIVFLFFKSSYLFDIYTEIWVHKIWRLGFALKCSIKTKCGAGERDEKGILIAESWW